MYQLPKETSSSADASRRFSSNNPFRQFEQGGQSSRSGSNSAFERWIEKNKQLVAEDSDDDLYRPYGQPIHANMSNSSVDSQQDVYNQPVNGYNHLSRPVFPAATRAGSDSSVNYSNRRMSSNNPFASAITDNDGFSHRREAPPIPVHSRSRKGSTPPQRPPKEDLPAPPSYEEAAGPTKAKSEYPREKSSPSSRRHEHLSRPHRSHSDSGANSKKGRSHRSEREKRKGKKAQPEPVKAKNLDTIDKLDVTAFFGSGFHHDGPFDACTTHRNKNVKAAPVMAFPADGPNNSIKGAGNVTKDEQLNLAFGHYTEDHNEIVGSRGKPTAPSGETTTPLIKTNRTHNDLTTSLQLPKQNPSVINFDSNVKADQVHGPSTAGLGSSTFLDGAPAPKAVAPENDNFLSINNGGLGRKKSLVQRLRRTGSENNSRRNSNEGRADTVSSFDSEPNEGGNSLLRRVKSLKVGRR